MPPLSWERLRGIPPFLFPPPRLLVFATTRIPFRNPLLSSLDDATAIVYASNLSASETIVRPIAMSSGRLHDFSNFRSYTIESCKHRERCVCSRFKISSRGICVLSNKKFSTSFPSVYLTKILLFVYLNVAVTLKYSYNTFPLINVWKILTFS